MVLSTAQSITSIGFIGSGQLAERIARKLVKNVVPKHKFCYKTQQLVSTLIASDPLQERRTVFQQLGFQTTDKDQDVMTDRDLVFLERTAHEALVNDRLTSTSRRYGKNTLFVSLMGDLPANQIEQLLCPGAKVIRMTPQTPLPSSKDVKQVKTEKVWATTRNAHATAEDVKRVMEIAGITTCIEGNEQEITVLPLNRENWPKSSDKDDFGSSTVATIGQSFHEEYILGECIGRGQFAQVFKAKHRVTGKEYAVKCVRIDEVDEQENSHHGTLLTEVAALKRIQHQNIIAHYGFYIEKDKYYLVLDHCNGGSVRHLMDQGRVSEEQAKFILQQLLQGIEYCHHLGHVHRDIKAENVLLVSDPLDSSNYQVKLADFGLSTALDATGYLQEMCGTPQYLSPEMVSGRTYGTPSDIWSAGIIAYMLLSGRIPFESATDEIHLHQLIRLGAVLYHYPEWKNISKDAQDFVQSMLDITPDSRATASELLAHKWLKK